MNTGLTGCVLTRLLAAVAVRRHVDIGLRLGGRLDDNLRPLDLRLAPQPVDQGLELVERVEAYDVGPQRLQRGRGLTAAVDDLEQMPAELGAEGFGDFALGRERSRVRR